jgi:hypothetical protein
MRGQRVVALWLGMALGATGAAFSQEGFNRYEMQYGEAVEVTLDMLAQMPESYRGRAVRTSGNLEMVDSNTFRIGRLGIHIPIYPVPEIVDRFGMNAHTWIGREIEITGVVNLGQDPTTYASTPTITFWAFFAPEDEKKAPPPASPETTLESLVTQPERYDGKRVRVVGQFRGANLFGDLPSDSLRRSDDWVLKNDLFAVWVTGRKPRGSSFKLDPRLRRDTGKWLMVDGRARTLDGIVYIDADAVALTNAPSPEAGARDTPAAPPPPLEPPVIVFSLPLDGERDIPPGTVFHVQFSNDMDVESFEGRVGLRYAGRPRPGDRPLDAVKLSYDLGRRSLSVDPGDQLRPGRVVELILLPGIVDVDGLDLQTRPGHEAGGAVDVLRYRVAGGLLTGATP